MLDEKSRITDNATKAEPAKTDEAVAVDTAVDAEGTAVLPPEDKKNKIWKSVRYWVALNIGILALSFGVYMFEDPNGFFMGGVSGLSIFLAKIITPFVPWLTFNVFMLIINGVLLVIGFIFLGKGVGLKTVYCAVMYTLEVNLFVWIHPVHGPISGETDLLEAIYAVVTVGIGQAIIFYCGATSGGTDIIAMIVKKYKKMNIGAAIITVDFVIAALAFLPIISVDVGTKIGLLSILGVTLRAFAIDGIIENIAKTKYVTIVTSKPEIASNIIIKDLDRGFTKYAAQGGYTGDSRTIIITVCKRTQAIRLKEKLHKEDPTAFTIITDANEILGNGFAAKF